jgi:hypothetical protein
MKRLHSIEFAVILAAVLLLAGTAAPLALAQGGDKPAAPDDAYSISWYTVDGGGGTSAGEPFTLLGTAGQPDAGTLTGGDYTLTGGFWYARPAAAIWLPLVFK